MKDFVLNFRVRFSGIAWAINFYFMESQDFRWLISKISVNRLVLSFEILRFHQFANKIQVTRKERAYKGVNFFPFLFSKKIGKGGFFKGDFEGMTLIELFVLHGLLSWYIYIFLNRCQQKWEFEINKIRELTWHYIWQARDLYKIPWREIW